MINASDTIKFFKIAHVNVSFRVNHTELFKFIHRWMKDFEVSPVKKHEKCIQVTLRHYEQDQPLPYKIPAQAKQTHQNESATYYTYRNLWIVDFTEAGIMIVNRSTLKILGLVYSHIVLESLWNLEIFMHPLYELMRQEGLYAHHAAAVCYEEFGLLLLGKSGQGKSTLSIDLLDKGFSFLADDRCFLVNQGENIEVIGFYEPAKLFASNVNHIQKLNPITQEFNTDKKKPLDVRLYYPEKMRPTSLLNAIVFPHWSPNEKSRIENVSPGKTLLELLPLTMVCLDVATCKAHFQFSGELVNRIPAIRLIMGSDRENWHPLLLDFISQARR